MAKQADKYSIIRSFTHRHYGHETGHLHRARPAPCPSAELVYPSIGAVVALKKGYEGGLQGAAAAVHHAHRSAGPVLGRRVPGHQVQDVCHRRRPERQGFPRPGARPARRRDARSGCKTGGRCSRPSTRSAKEMDKEGLFQTMDAFQEKAYGIAPGRRQEGLRHVPGEGRPAGAVRPQSLRAVAASWPGAWWKTECPSSPSTWAAGTRTPTTSGP